MSETIKHEFPLKPGMTERHPLSDLVDAEFEKCIAGWDFKPAPYLYEAVGGSVFRIIPQISTIVDCGDHKLYLPTCYSPLSAYLIYGYATGLMNGVWVLPISLSLEDTAASIHAKLVAALADMETRRTGVWRKK